MRRDPRFLGRAALSILVLVVCAGVLEGGARLAGYAPWPVNRGLLGQSEGLHRVDAKLGWKKQEGRFRIERFGREIEVSHWPSERRATSAEPVARARQILVLGGSFAYGLGLSDDETFPWMMQQRDWRFEWLNLATSGYGTYQALLTLEEHLAPTIERLEREYLEAVLRTNQGRVAESAEQAGVSRRTLLRKMKALNINKADFKK